MKYLSLLTSSAAVFLTIGCGNNSTGETIYVPKDGSGTVNTATSTDTNGIVPANTITAPDFFQGTSPTSTTQNPVQSTTTVVESGLNPEHGKPGHRCEIAVGAPLNSPAQPSTTPAITAQPSIGQQPPAIVTNPQPAKEVAAGMNPEHGKPGHRCDIAVGAPLNSKPAEVKQEQKPASDKPVASPVTPLLPASNTPASPLLPASNIPSTPVAAGMNPEHGKPGHRCDIAVGAPLPKQ